MNKGEVLYCVLHFGDHTVEKLKYLENSWLELVTNSDFRRAYLSKGDICGTLIHLVKSKVIQENDVLDYLRYLPENEIVDFMVESFPLRMCITLYNLLGMCVVKTARTGNVEVISSIITMSGDLETFSYLYTEIAITRDYVNIFNMHNGYFKGAARNKESLSWLTPERFYVIPHSVFGESTMGIFIREIRYDVSLIAISREVFDILRGDKDPRTFALKMLPNDIPVYEVLFQTGYFPYSFFTDELPRTAELEKWLEQSIDI